MARASLARTVLELFRKDSLGFLVKTRSLKMWFVMALIKQGVSVIETDKDIIISYRDCLFHLNPITSQPIFTAYDHYRFDDIQPNDIVLDIGAQAGAFTIPAAKKAKWVYAIEPLFGAELRMNLVLNNIKNVTVIEQGLANKNGEMVLEYWGISALCRVSDLKTLESLTGKIDFLKLDCEGYEWSIQLEQLAGIRRIEAELHTIRGHRLKDWIKWLKESGYHYELEYKSHRLMMMLHATKM